MHLKENNSVTQKLYDHLSQEKYRIGDDHDYIIIQPYDFRILICLNEVNTFNLNTFEQNINTII